MQRDMPSILFLFPFQLGIIGMLIIAILTDHCCHLIVKTKHSAIRKLLKNRSNSRQNTSSSQNYSSYNKHDSELDDEDGDETPFISGKSNISSDEEDSMQSSSDHHEHIVRHMMYGDIGKICYGKYGIGVVNFAIAVTQFGFCVAYFIFIGNTVHSLFPTEKCQVINGSVVRPCDRVYNISSEVDLHRKDLSPTIDPLYDLFQSNSSSAMPVSNFTVTTVPTISNVTSSVTVTTTLANITSTPASNVTNATTTHLPIVDTFKYITTAPDLKILVACPLVVFVVFSLIRNVRYLGMVSVLANLSILGGCISVFVFLILGEYSALKA